MGFSGTTGAKSDTYVRRSQISMPIAINPAQAAAKSRTQIASLISVRGIGANAPGPREGPGASCAANHESGRIVMCIKRYALDRRVTSVQDKLYTRVVFLARHRSLPGLEIRGHCRYRPDGRALSQRAGGPRRSLRSGWDSGALGSPCQLQMLDAKAARAGILQLSAARSCHARTPPN